MWLNLYGRETVQDKLITGKNCIFCVFRPFFSLSRTASQPYRLSHINTDSRIMTPPKRIYLACTIDSCTHYIEQWNLLHCILTTRSYVHHNSWILRSCKHFQKWFDLLFPHALCRNHAAFQDCALSKGNEITWVVNCSLILALCPTSWPIVSAISPWLSAVGWYKLMAIFVSSRTQWPIRRRSWRSWQRRADRQRRSSRSCT